MKILVVDDELVSRKKILRIMQSFGECEAVEKGADAVVAFTEAWDAGMPFDMISLDIVMPDMSGIDVLNSIREIEKEKGLPKKNQVKIMMVTSHSDKDNVIASMKAGCNNYIVKPFDRERVARKMESLGFNIDI